MWRERYRELGEEGLRSRRRGPHNHPNKTPDEVLEKILHLRRTYHMGPIRIVWYLRRYHGIKTSDATVYRVCKRHGLNRLPNRVGRRAVHTHRYEKQVPGHHVQIEVKFLTLKHNKDASVRRYQHTAIDDATRVRALKIYRRHTQANAIDFINYVVDKFPFRIRTIRTDRGHEFQALFHWHVADLGMEHVYIRPRTPQLNGKVERSHRTDKDEFYQLLTYRDDVDDRPLLGLLYRLPGFFQSFGEDPAFEYILANDLSGDPKHRLDVAKVFFRAAFSIELRLSDDDILERSQGYRLIIHLDQRTLRKRPSMKGIAVCEIYVRFETALMMNEIEVPSLRSEHLPDDDFLWWAVEFFQWKQLYDARAIPSPQREHEITS